MTGFTGGGTTADFLFTLDWCVTTIREYTGVTISRGRALDMLGTDDDAAAVEMLDDPVHDGFHNFDLLVNAVTTCRAETRPAATAAQRIEASSLERVLDTWTGLRAAADAAAGPIEHPDGTNREGDDYSPGQREAMGAAGAYAECIGDLRELLGLPRVAVAAPDAPPGSAPTFSPPRSWLRYEHLAKGRDVLGDPEGAEETVVARDRAREGHECGPGCPVGDAAVEEYKRSGREVLTTLDGRLSPERDALVRAQAHSAGPER